MASLPPTEGEKKASGRKSRTYISRQLVGNSILTAHRNALIVVLSRVMQTRQSGAPFAGVERLLRHADRDVAEMVQRGDQLGAGLFGCDLAKAFAGHARGVLSVRRTPPAERGSHLPLSRME